MARQRTLAGGLNQSGDHSKFTRPVSMIDAVPTGLFGCESGTPDSLEVAVDGRLEVGGDGGFGIVEDGAWGRGCRCRLGGRRWREHA